MELEDICRKVAAVNNAVEAKAKNAKKGSTSMFSVKGIVSKKKNRFNMDGFDLDLTYVTENVIAMGFPSQGVESLYRNSYKTVKKFLETRHNNKHRVYNLCIEKSKQYGEELFQDVVCYPIHDHHVPDFFTIIKFCIDVHTYISQSPRNVAAVHCKAGKGRTGMMICCYLIFSKLYVHAKDVLLYYSLVRTSNAKGVTIPSQIRYVYYFEHAYFFIINKMKEEIHKTTGRIVQERDLVIDL